ncbi:MAG: phospholipid carrier-dependent glycosyltransferase [Candidatus Bathyarchaeota archaeon]|nr:phospholipid carrier-dependent glycosyltransferase [Candidatus Bathyarchaeota archaeon]
MSVATWNLGVNQAPITTAQFSSDDSFYVDLGEEVPVDSVLFLLKDNSYNLSLYKGSPENWQAVTSNWEKSEYYKWDQIGFSQTTQYIKVEFGASSNAVISEMTASTSDNEQIPITTIVNLSSENVKVQNLVDEQDKIQLPITYMSQTYFDEIYFARTAEQYLNLQSPYEWTHPPLGKLIQAAGIAAFGYNPFGWRITGVLFATLMIPVMYLLGKKLFGTWIGGFASAFLLTFDFMHFAMGRMGTVDTYLVFFALLSQLSFFTYFKNVAKNGWKTPVLPLFLALVFFALAFSTKWVVMYGTLGMLALLAAMRINDLRKLKKSLSYKFAGFFDHPFLLLIAFAAIAVGIYFLIYIPDMLTGRPFYEGSGRGVVDLQFAMYNYHSTLEASHSFGSPWWSWPFMVSTSGYVPLWLDITYLPNNVVSTISAFGNPAVWWVGFASMIVVAIEAVDIKALFKRLRHVLDKRVKESAEQLGETQPPSLDAKVPSQIPESAPAGCRWNVAAVFIATVFFFSWIPYVLISRVTFIYHYFVCVPLLCLASAYVINNHWSTRKGKIVTLIFFAAVVAMFILFYPVISGVPTDSSYIQYLKWFPSWYFAP